MMFYHVLSRLPDKCLVHSIESSNVTIHKKKMDDMPYCNRYNVVLYFIGLENFTVNL